MEKCLVRPDSRELPAAQDGVYAHPRAGGRDAGCREDDGARSQDGLHLRPGFYAWTIDQAASLSAGAFRELDLENLAEENEDLGKDQFSKIRSAFRIILLHMLKWDHQPERRSRSGAGSIATHRIDLDDVLLENPSPRASPGGSRAPGLSLGSGSCSSGDKAREVYVSGGMPVSAGRHPDPLLRMAGGLIASPNEPIADGSSGSDADDRPRRARGQLAPPARPRRAGRMRGRGQGRRLRHRTRTCGPRPRGRGLSHVLRRRAQARPRACGRCFPRQSSTCSTASCPASSPT